MIKNVTQLKCAINGKEIVFICDMDCSTVDVKEALYQFIKYVGQIEDAAKAKNEEEKQPSEDIPSVESKIEPIGE